MKLNTKVNFIRCIDVLVGIPLCFFFTFFHILSRLFPHKSPSKDQGPPKVLLIKLTEMGSVILSYPLMSRLKKVYPGAQLYFLTLKRNKGVFPLLDKIVDEDHILTVREDNFFAFLTDLCRVPNQLRKERFDIVFDLEFFSRLTAVFSFLTGAPKRIGFYRYGFEGLYRGRLMTHNVQYNPLLHIGRQYLSLSQTVHCDSKMSPELDVAISDDELVLPPFHTDHEVHKRIKKRLNELGIMEGGKLVMMSPGEGAIPLREWPVENFISLAQTILQDSRNHILIAGEKSATQKDKMLQEAVGHERCFNLTGTTTLPELMEFFLMADALIVNDSGLGHLASLTPIHKFILFGPESPQVFAPLGKNQLILYSKLPCSPCLSILNHRQSFCRDNRCLKVISPDDVYRLLQRVLEGDQHQKLVMHEINKRNLTAS